ncbi:uncharacterized protein BJX67DRAFT_378771 [Aspergillus lucknowensis]|uniref:DUF7770 domain-containing protein n=1 Tax=Aspergillus lucknowensis TaxID=176173 RepID=A0ABR4LYY4_9EURO
MPKFQAIHFIPKSRQAQILELPVHKIIAAPHSKESNTNHWCFYLATSDSTSVCVDCQPSYSAPSTLLHGGSKGHVIISELPYLCPQNTEAQFHHEAPPNTKVKDIYNLLIENGRHKYEFDHNGVGCRYWVTDQINLLLEYRIIVNYQEAAAAKHGIKLLWPDQTPHPLDQGAYYQN